MNRSGAILLVIIVLTFSNHNSYSQNSPGQADTLQQNSKKVQPNEDAEGQVSKQNTAGQTGTSGMNSGLQTVRQVRGGRPDMSKAGGARPPIIVRPAGSGIPRGVGKPGGAGRYGGR